MHGVSHKLRAYLKNHNKRSNTREHFRFTLYGQTNIGFFHLKKRAHMSYRDVLCKS